MDDLILVRRMLDGDEAAFASFFDQHLDRLFRFALARTAAADSAEDIVQTTFINAIRRLETWRGEASLWTWLCSICRREIQARGGSVELIDDRPDVQRQLAMLTAASGTAPDILLQQAELARLVHTALDYLPPRYAEVLEWKYLEGFAVQEIAERVSATPKAVEAMITRARRAFRLAFTALTEGDPSDARSREVLRRAD